MFEALSAALFMGPVAVGFILVLLIGYREFLDESRKVTHDPVLLKNVEDIKLKMLMNIQFLITPIIFGFACWFLFIGSDSSRPIIIAAGLNLCLAGLFCLTGQGLILKIAIKRHVQHIGTIAGSAGVIILALLLAL